MKQLVSNPFLSIVDDVDLLCTAVYPTQIFCACCCDLCNPVCVWCFSDNQVETPALLQSLPETKETTGKHPSSSFASTASQVMTMGNIMGSFMGTFAVRQDDKVSFDYFLVKNLVSRVRFVACASFGRQVMDAFKYSPKAQACKWGRTFSNYCTFCL